MDSNHQFGLPYHAVTIHSETPASLKTHNNFNAHSARRALWCRSHSPKELPASRVDKWHNDRSLHRHPNVLPPGQKLRDAVDLVVMATVREREHFAQEFGMPGGVFREVDLSRLELGGLRRHPIHLLATGPTPMGRIRPTAWSFADPATGSCPALRPRSRWWPTSAVGPGR